MMEFAVFKIDRSDIFSHILMRKILLIFLTFALLGSALHLDQSHLHYNYEEKDPRSSENEEPQGAEEPYIPELPLYIGQGYNIYQGNPMTKNIDPGFTLPIFDFTFDRREKTGDGQYRIPDHTLSRQLSSCSYDASVKAYTGASSYKKQLETFVGVEAGYDGMFKAAFSLSTDFQSMQKRTSEEHSVVTQAYSQCQVYKVFLDSTRHLILRESFIQTVKNALGTNNWDQFINKYGTHYVVEGTLGGRAVQQMSFSQDSVSNFNSQGTTIEVGASAQFMNFFVGVQTANTVKSKAYSLAENLKKEKHEYFVGGRPTSKGNAYDWMKQVQKRPMPIKYQLKDISHLFELIKDINVNDAKAKFKTALGLFCQNNKNCREPKPDYVPPPPPPPRAPQCEMRWSSRAGGSRGAPFYYTASNPENNQLREVTVRHGRVIDSIGLTFGYQPSPMFGGNGGRVQRWIVPYGQRVSTVLIRYEQFVNGIQFKTNIGYESPWFGGHGGNLYIVDVGNDKIVGFNGSWGDFLDSIAFQICHMT